MLVDPSGVENPKGEENPLRAFAACAYYALDELNGCGKI